MRTSIALLILALTASQVMTTCPGADPLSAVLTTAVTGYVPTLLVSEIVASGTAGTAATAGSACGWATTDLLCAPQAKLVADIQTYLNYEKTAMQTAAGVRDTYIIEKRGEVVTVISSLRRLNELAKSVTIPATFLAMGTKLVGYADTIAANFTAIVENFATYQETRATCMNALLKTHAAILCNSFVDATITGVTHHATTPAIALSDTFLGTLNTECTSYITNSVRQSSIIITAAYSKALTNLVSGIEKLSSGDATGAATALSSAFTTIASVTFSSTASQVPAQTPATPTKACTGTACGPFLETIFSATTGVIDQTIAVRGGEPVPVFTYTPSRVLSEGNERRLAATGLNPTLATYTFTYGFASNPANVDNTKNAKSALRNGVVAVVVAALALVF